jgi:hypothetical protein
VCGVGIFFGGLLKFENVFYVVIERDEYACIA